MAAARDIDGEWQWRALFMMAERLGTNTDHNQAGNSTYRLQARTNKCARRCIATVTMKGLYSLEIRASGASHWNTTYDEKLCGNIPSRSTGPDQRDTQHQCKEVEPQSLLTTTTATGLTGLLAGQPGAVTGGVVAGVVIVAVINCHNLFSYV